MKQEEIDESIKEELAADGKLDEYDEQSDEKENEILQSHLLQMQQIDEDEEEEAGGGGDKKREKTKTTRGRKLAKSATNGRAVLIWGPP
jgi:hypothetical protein